MAMQDYSAYESPRMKLEKRLRSILGAHKGDCIANAIADYAEELQQDTINRINKTGEHDPDY